MIWLILYTIAILIIAVIPPWMAHRRLMREYRKNNTAYNETLLIKE